MNWPALPFVRLLLPFAAGIYLGTLPMTIPLLPMAIGCGALFFLLLFYDFPRRRLAYRQRRWFGILLFAWLLACGYFLCLLRTPRHHPQHLGHHEETAVFWQFRIEKIKTGERSVRLQGSVTAVADSNHSVRPVTGRLLLYLSPDSTALGLNPQDRLLVKSPIQRISPPKNPEAFDYAAYLQKKGIYHQAFAGSEAWTLLAAGQDFGGRYLNRLQTYCLDVLKQHLPNENELAVGAALIMGARDLVSEDIRAAYTATGAIHILAVSGLHVGMIYLGLAALFRLLGWKGGRRRKLRSLLLIVAVWSFAVFTGGSASVLRAASMFTFIILGEALYRRQHIYNTLAASAFLLLCIQPYLLLDVGFQLSYLAVVGIVFFQGRLYRTWHIPHRAGDYLWKLASVSIAAQLTTLPISLFYFHQFPFYFWLSGWIVVPAAMIILGLGLCLLLVNALAPVAALLGAALQLVIAAMNVCIFYVRQLPAALWTGIWLEAGMVLLLYFTLFCLMKGLYEKRLGAIQLALICLLALGCWRLEKLLRAERQQVLIVYHIYKHTALDIFDGRRAFGLSDLPADHPDLQTAVENFRAARQIDQPQQHTFRDTGLVQAGSYFRKRNFIQFGKIKMAVIGRLPPKPPPKPLEVDYLLVRNSPDIDLEVLDRYFRAGLILFDASNNRRQVDRWTAICKDRQQPYYDISREGAWIVDLKDLE